MADRYDRFLQTLASFEGTADLTNPWSFARRSAPNRIRRANLRRYLTRFEETGSTVMFVGEALGHRGGRLSGVPFTSLSLLLEGDHDLLGKSVGYRDPGDGGKIRREASATMIWSAIERLPQPPLLWNAVPFHPHRPGDPRTNRRPRAAELELGMSYLRRLAALFDIERFVAVGRAASLVLARLEIEHTYVRHPSVGGKSLFDRGIAELIEPVELDRDTGTRRSS